MFFDVIEKRSAELTLLEDLISREEVKIQKAFLDFVNRVSSDEVIRSINRYLLAGDVLSALAIIDYEGATLGTAANAVFTGSAAREATTFLAQLRRLSPKAPLAFNPVDPIFAQVANLTAVQFVRETTQTQKDAILYALQAGYGQGTRKMAQLIRGSIGLTTKQMQTAANYRSLLERGSSLAKERELRDKRYDRSIERAVSGQALKPEQIDKMVEAYSRGLIKNRAKVIAQTEGGHIVELARETGFRQMLQQAGISTARATHTWNTRRDAVVRSPEHTGLDGQTQPLNEPYRAPDGTLMIRPKDPSAPAHQRCGCRCFQRFKLTA